MFRIGQIAGVFVRNTRSSSPLSPSPSLTWQHLTVAGQPIRLYSKKDCCDKKVDTQARRTLKLPECRPVELKPCRPPPVDCDDKSYPALQDCGKPSYLSECPKPECSRDPTPNNNKRFLILGLLLAALGIGSMIWYTNQEDKPKTKKQKAKAVKTTVLGVVKNPLTSKDIPKDIPYLLIGGGTAAFSAFRAIKSSDPLAKVLVISNEGFFPYMRPPLSKEIWSTEEPDLLKKLEFKQWNGTQRSLFYEPADFYTECDDLLISDNGGVSVATGWTITKLDVVERIAYLDDGCEIKYDKCLVATGSMPKNLELFINIDESVKDRVNLYRNIQDYQCLAQNLKHAKTVAIVGGGFLGSELACSLGRYGKKHNLKVYQIFKECGNMAKILPEYLSLWTTDRVIDEGVEVIPYAHVTAAVPATGGTAIELTLSNGDTVTVDEVIVTIGSSPNTELADASQLEVDPDFGGFLVNTELQARSDLYVAGDAACFFDARFGRRRLEHHDHAVVSGRLAGENMTGARKPYLHQSMFWSDLSPEVGYEAVGVIEHTLPTVGVFAKASSKDSPKEQVVASDGTRSSGDDGEIPPECEKYANKADIDSANQKAQEDRKVISKPGENEDFGKGVIFYLRDDIVVGVVLWNVFNRMNVARQVLADERKYDDLNEVAKLFNIHEE